MANLVPPYERRGAYHGTSAALEFAVTGLKVEDSACGRGLSGQARAPPGLYPPTHPPLTRARPDAVVVLGHQRCGGIATLMRRGGPAEVRNDFSAPWRRHKLCLAVPRARAQRPAR